ncbi:MAG: hypothetical protein KDA41_10310, partial [Planctomycetales bacterium]|nr:hypothetical protein [Planctomycetales bacterium]
MVGFLFLAGVAAAWFAPQIVAGTALREQIIPRLLPQLSAKSSIGSAALGWNSPVELGDVQVVDAEGRPVVAVAALRTEKTLWQLLQNQHALGKIHVDGLAAQIVLRADGSNLEDILAPLLAGGASPSPSFEIALTNGAVAIVDAAQTQRADVQNVDAQIAASGAAGDLDAVVQGTVVAGSESGALHLLWRQTANGGAENSANAPAQIQIVAQDVPLSAGGLLLSRLAVAGQLAGSLTGRLQLEPAGPGQWLPLSVAGEAQTQGLAAYIPQWLGDEPLKAARLHATGKAVVRQEALTADNLKLDSDLGTLQVRGTLPTRLLSETDFAQALAAMQSQSLDVQGEVDIARLAALFPRAMRLRQDTQVTAGMVRFAVAALPAADQTRWQCQLQMDQLAANAGGAPIVWAEPISLRLDVVRQASQVRIDELLCQSSFLSITGQGALDEATLAVEMDLGRLAADLGRFVEIDPQPLSGKGQMKLHLARGDEQTVSAKGVVRIEQLIVALAGRTPCREESLDVDLSGVVLVSPDGKQIDVQQGAVTLSSGGDRCTVALRQPIGQLSAASVWPVQIEATGQLATWTPRLQWLAPIDRWRLAGEMKLTGVADVSRQGVAVAASQCDVTNLVAEGPDGFYWSEQLAQLTWQGTAEWATGQVTATPLTLAATSCSLRADNVAVHPVAGQSPVVAGQFAYRADLRRLMQSMQRRGEPLPEIMLRGQTEGKIDLAVAQGVTTGVVAAQFDNFAVDSTQPRTPTNLSGGVMRPVSNAAGAVPIWSDRQLRLASNLKYIHPSDTLQIESGQIDGSGARLVCQGQIGALSTAPQFHLQGQATYNLAVLVQRMQAVIGGDLQLADSDTANFFLEGPLYAAAQTPTALASADGHGAAAVRTISPDLRAGGSFAWKSAALLGLPIGPGQLQAELRRGVLEFQPLAL